MSMFGNIANTVSEVLARHDLGELGTTVGEMGGADALSQLRKELESRDLSGVFEEIAGKLNEMGAGAIEALEAGEGEAASGTSEDMIVAEPVEASADSGAQSHAPGDDVIFAEMVDPGMEPAAHEATHVIQAAPLEADDGALISAQAEAGAAAKASDEPAETEAAETD